MRKLNPDPGIDGEPAPEQPTKNDLMAHAARLLARREFAVRELEARLLRKWAAAEKIQVLVNDVISTLQADGALSDARFADSFIRSRQQRFLRTGHSHIPAEA